MGKTVPESKFTELKGLDRISTVVHEMKCLWREISKDDFGIDGEIEVVTPKPDGKGFQTTGGIVKVQARSGASYVAWDSGETFAVSVSKEDLEYWNSCTFPVLLIVYHPKDDKLYCKEIKSYVPSTSEVFRAPYQVRFDKAEDEFAASYYESVCHYATVSPPRISFDEKEKLFSNLLPVTQLPRAITHAPTRRKVHEHIKEEVEGPVPPFCIVEGRLYTLADLRNEDCVLRQFCGKRVKRMRAARWIEEEARRKDFVFLLNQLLGKHLGKCGIRYNPAFGRNYFPRENEQDNEFKREWVSVRTNRTAPPRIVAKYYEYGAFKFWRHLAAEIAFRQFGDKWFLRIVPMYFFTDDGETPSDSELVGPYTTVLKAKEHNSQVLNHVLFWSHVLSMGRPFIGFRLEGKTLVKIEKLPFSGIAGFAIPDDPATFEEKTPPERQFTLFGWHEEEEEAQEEDEEYDEY
jgi:hypothetical protein